MTESAAAVQQGGCGLFLPSAVRFRENRVMRITLDIGQSPISGFHGKILSARRN